MPASTSARPAAANDETLLALRLLDLASDLTRSYAVHVRGRHGLSIARLALLLCIDRSTHEVPRPADLATALGCSRATVTRLLQGLARDGLVAPRKDRDDGRARRIALTAAGARVVRELRPAQERRLEALLWHLNDADRRDLARLIERLQAGLRALSSP